VAIRDEITGRGWRFPILPDPRGRLGYAGGVANIEQSLKLILLTRFGERVMRREFGSALHDTVFAPGSEQGLRALETGVAEAVRDWEPRIDLLSVAASADPRAPSRVVADLSYEVRATYVRGNLVFPLYLEGGTAPGGGGA
jgi:phage baseplate assembly protein W